MVFSISSYMVVIWSWKEGLVSVIKDCSYREEKVIVGWLFEFG